jgi:transcriptional regulator with XRE-family HTH domain
MVPADHRYSSEGYEAQREQSLRRFGRLVRRWRIANGWTQYVGDRITKECGIPSLTPSNWSNIENGKAGDLKPGTLFRLAELNWRVANKDFPGAHSRELRDWLEGSRAIVSPDGVPWCATEFFACAQGLMEPPDWLSDKAVPSLTDADAAQLCEGWRKQMKKAIAEHNLDPLEVLQGISLVAQPGERLALRQMLAGARDYTAAELQEHWNQEWLPDRILQTWTMQILHKTQ